MSTLSDVCLGCVKLTCVTYDLPCRRTWHFHDQAKAKQTQTDGANTHLHSTARALSVCGRRREPIPLAAGGVRVLAAHIGTRAALWPAPLLHSHGPTAKGLGDGEGVLPDGEGVFGGTRNGRLLHLHAIDSAAITNESNSGVSS